MVESPDPLTCHALGAEPAFSFSHATGFAHAAMPAAGNATSSRMVAARARVSRVATWPIMALPQGATPSRWSRHAPGVVRNSSQCHTDGCVVERETRRGRIESGPPPVPLHWPVRRRLSLDGGGGGRRGRRGGKRRRRDRARRPAHRHERRRALRHPGHRARRGARALRAAQALRARRRGAGRRAGRGGPRHLGRRYRVPMAHTKLEEAAGLSVADVLHRKFSALPADTTIGAVRDWFAASTSRRMAFLADGERYVGSLTRDEVEGDLDPGAPGAKAAPPGPTVLPEAPASEGEQLALRTDARRVPVVDRDGRLLGVVSVTEDRQAFCGTGDAPGDG